MAYKNFADTIQQTIKSVGCIDDDYSVGAPTMGNGLNELNLYYEKELHLSVMQEELKQSKVLSTTSYKTTTTITTMTNTVTTPSSPLNCSASALGGSIGNTEKRYRA